MMPFEFVANGKQNAVSPHIRFDEKDGALSKARHWFGHFVSFIVIVAAIMFQFSCFAGTVIRSVTCEGEWDYTLTANQNSAASTDVFNVTVPDGYVAEVTVTGHTVSGYADTWSSHLCEGAAIRGYFNGVAKEYSMTFAGGGGSFNLNASVSAGYYSTIEGPKPYTKYYCTVYYTITVRFIHCVLDVTVSSLTIKPSSEIMIGDSCQLVFEIKNIGYTKAKSFSIRVCDGERVLETLTSEALAASGSRSYTVDIVSPSLGEHTYSVWADSGETVTEDNELNNTARKSLVVHPRVNYTIRYFANGGIGAQMEDSKFVGGTPGKLNRCTYKKDGYIFYGWSLSETNATVKFRDGGQVNLKPDDEGLVYGLYAVWRKIETRKVVYYPNGGTGSSFSQLITNGVSFAVAECPFSRTKYEFVGWGLSNTNHPDLASASSYTYDKYGSTTVKCYAIWGQRIAPEYCDDSTLTLYTTASILYLWKPVASGTQLTTNGRTVTLDTVGNYALKGIPYRGHVNFLAVCVTGPGKLHFRCLPFAMYDVNATNWSYFQSENERSIDKVSYYQGDATTRWMEFNIDVPAGRHLYSWWTYSEVKSTSGDCNTLIVDDIRWVDIPKVSYLPGTYGSGDAAEDAKQEDETLTLRGAIFTRAGYTQTGWSTTDGGAKEYALGASYTENAALTLYPVWTPNTYTVTYKPGSNGSGVQQTATKTHGVALTLKGAIFSRTDYNQTGWSTTDGGVKKYELCASYTTDAALTLYPVWTAKSTVIQIAKPRKVTGLTYTGNSQTGVTSVYLLLTKTGTSAATAAGTYTATYALPANTTTKTYQWSDGTTTNVTVSWSIAARGVSDSTITFASIPDQTYTGSAITPSVTMTYSGVTRTLGTDYTLSYANNTSVGTASVTVTGKGNFTGTKTLYFSIVTAPATISADVALDNTTLTFSVGGSPTSVSNWFGQAITTHDGVDAMRSGAIGNCQTNWVNTTVSGAGTLSFWWYVSSEARYDFLEFLVDGSVIKSISGQTNNWTQVEYSITSTGTHGVQWRYRKDVSRGYGDDAGYLDQVVWTPNSTPPDVYPDGVYTNIIDGVAWAFSICGGKAMLGTGKAYSADTNSTAGVITIPSMLGGHPVVRIADYAFYYCSKLTSVTIPSSVTSIGYAAFSDCSGLTSVTIPSSVTNIGEYAFSDCSGLTSVTIPSSVTSIGNWAFCDCYGLTSVTIPSSVTSIGAGAFYGCSVLTSVTIPSSVTSICRGAFSKCSRMTVISVDSASQSYVSIGGVLYSKDLTTVVVCPGGKTSVIIPASVTHIGDSAFNGCSGLTSVAIPKGVTSIGDWAFCACYGLTSVTIPSSVTSIGDYAFWYCRKLTSVTIPSSVTSIGEGAFSTCSGLTTVYVDAGDATRVRTLLADSGCSTSGLTFTETSSAETYRVAYAPGRYGTGTQQTATKTQGVALTLAGAIFTRLGYTQTGWSTTDGGAKAYDLGASYVVNAAVTLYPYWSLNSNPSGAYVAVGTGCEGMGTVSGGKAAKAGSKLTLRATAKKGYVFAGWYLDAGFETPAEGTVDYRSPSFAVIADEEGTTYYARFIPTEEDFAEIYASAEDEYVRGEAIEPIRVYVEAGSLPTVAVSGLPTGLKFTAKALDVKATKTMPAAHYDANTIYGTPTKSGIYTATVTVKTAGKVTASKTLKFIVRAANEAIIDVGYDTECGKVTGMGICATGKKLTLKATAKKGYVFAGWYYDDEPVDDLGVDYRTASLPVVGSGEDTLYYASFISAEEDAEIEVVVDEEYEVDGPCEIPVVIASYSLPTVTVKGLPTGLKFNAKTLMIYGTPTKPGTYTVTLSVKNTTVKKAITESFIIHVANIESPYLDVDYSSEGYVCHGGVAVAFDIGSCALDGYAVSSVSGLPSGLKFNSKTGMIEGTPSRGGTYTVTVTLKNGKEKSTATFTMTAEAIDSWAYGTFNGGNGEGQVQLTISNTGKLSGKYLSGGLTYTLSASAFASYEDGFYTADVTVTWSYKEDGKTVKESDVVEMSLAEGDAGGVVTCAFFGDAYLYAYQNLWSSREWKAKGLEVFGKKGRVITLSYEDDVGLSEGETVTVTIKSNGTVTYKGVFNTEQTDRNGNAITYKASGSSIVCVSTLDPFEGEVFVYFPPNEKKGFAGRSFRIDVGADE